MTMSYLASKKRALQYSFIAENLATDKKYQEADEDDKQDMIQDKLEDQEYMKLHIDPKMKTYEDMRLYGFCAVLEKQALLTSALDPITQEVVDEVEKQKNDLLAPDADKNTRLDDVQSQFSGNVLSENGKEELSGFVEDFDEHINTVGKKSFYNKYLPMLEYFDGNTKDDTMQKILASGQYDKEIAVYLQVIDSLKKKIQDKTVTPEDIALLKKTVDEYYAFQKSLAASSENISKQRDANGNGFMRYGFTARNAGKEVWHGMQLVGNGHWLE